MVNGRPRHPQSQGSVERSNSTLKDTLTAWLRDNNTSKWTQGLPFSQWALNTTYHEATKTIPYETLFGVKPRVGIRTHLTEDFMKKISNGIYEETFLQEVQNAANEGEILIAERLEQSEVPEVSAADLIITPGDTDEQQEVQVSDINSILLAADSGQEDFEKNLLEKANSTTEQGLQEIMTAESILTEADLYELEPHEEIIDDSIELGCNDDAHG